jgi:glycosyltransferase involved in cell wall biosynthesis
MSVINQTYKPKHIIIVDDSDEIKDLRKEEIYQNIFSNIDRKGITWEVIFGNKKGQVDSHNIVLEKSQTDWIWRIDDDEIAESNVLENLVKNITNNPGRNIGAIGGLVLDPKNDITQIPDGLTNNKIEDVRTKPNIQWFYHKGVKEVDHLYSSFLYKKSAVPYGYCTLLSPVSHREETILTYEIKRNGYKILVDPSATTWHHRSGTGGIRSYVDQNLWNNDESLFDIKYGLWNIISKNTKLIVLNNGLGDHFCFAKILPEIVNKYKDLVLSVCYPQIFEDYNKFGKYKIENKNFKLISIRDAIIYTNNHLEEHDLYFWMVRNNWDGSIENAFKRIYL